MDNRDVLPDAKVLAGIFPNLQPTSTEILLQHWGKCIFVARFDGDINSSQSSDRIVRLETPNDRFQVIAALERLAALTIPGLVPNGYQVGTIIDTKGRSFDFSVTQFIRGSTLHDVWHELDETQQDSIMQSVVVAVQKLQTLRLEDGKVQTILKDTPYFDGSDAFTTNGLEHFKPLGGPHLGYFTEGKALLDSILKYRKIKKTFCTIVPDTDGEGEGITTKSAYEELGSLHIAKADHQSWQNETVFCHNDLNPRNIMVQKTYSPSGTPEYQLAAIIDWEMAGFFPFAYELGLQNTYLGCVIWSYSMYTLFRKHAREKINFNTPSQASLLQAMDLIFDSQQKCLSGNVGAAIRRKWYAREKLVKATCVFDGWVRAPDTGELPQFKPEDEQKLIDDVLREMGRL
ncbi:hypothetical protein MMC14_005464 [Varicellaria rhodocarpa]|nr:hypothetical protein [Varicellaria rhodocarpa]